MWRNPDTLTTVIFGDLILKNEVSNLAADDFPLGITVGDEWSPWCIKLLQLLNESIRLVVDEFTESIFREATTPQDRFRRPISVFVRSIEEENLFSQLSEIHQAFAEIDDILSGKAFGFAAEILDLITRLLGTENSYLVGVKGGRPTYVTRPESIEPMSSEDFYGAANGDFLDYIGPSEVDLVPIGNRFPPSTSNHPWPSVSYERVRELMRDAYYSQRYVVDPSGAYVKIQGVKEVGAVLLKVRKAVGDPNNVDLIAHVELADGPILHVLDGLLSSGEKEEPYTNEKTRYRDYLSLLLAQVYHDLVTAVDIPIGFAKWRSNGKPELKRAVKPKERDDMSWIYIPRVIRGGEPILPRKPLAQPRA